MAKKENSLKNRIHEEMTVDYYNSLEKNFDLAKQIVRITKTGKVDVLFKNDLNGKEQILSYLIGKLYAKEAGLSSTDDVTNKELMEELGILEGSLYPWLKSLRDENKIRQSKREGYSVHSIPVNLLEKTLKEITTKLDGIKGEK